MGTLGTDVGMAVAIFPPKMRPDSADKGPADPVVRPAHECRLSRRLSSWTLLGGPPTCVCQCRGFVCQFFYVKWAHLASVMQDAIFCGFICVFFVFSSYFRLVSLQSKNHQSSWNLLVITPTTTVDVHSSCLYAGVDGINFALKDHHQQAPPHLIFARPRAKSHVTMKHYFKRCDASIKVIPCHSSYLWIFEVSTMWP